MRILFIPWCGAKFTGDSNFLLFRRLARELAKQGCFSTIAVPTGFKQPDEPGVEYMEALGDCEQKLDFHTEEAALNYRDLIKNFSWRYGNKYIDLVITSRLTAFGTISSILGIRDMWGTSRPMPVLFFDPFPEQEIEGVEYAQMAANSGYGTTMFLTEGDRQARIRNIGRNFSAAFAKRLEERSIAINLGVNYPEIKAIREKSTKFPKFTLYFGGRLNRSKSVDEILHLYNRLYSMGKDWQIVLTTGTGIPFASEVLTELEKNHKIEVYRGLPWEQYISVAARSHVFLTLSRGDEGLPIGFWEQMYAGCVGIFPSLPWAAKQIPKEYPFQYERLDQALAMILDIEKDYLKAQQALPMIWDRVEKDFGYQEGIKKLLAFMKPYQLRTKVGGGAGDLITEIVTGRDFFSMNYVKKELMRKGNVFTEPGILTGWRIPSYYDVYKFLLENGFRDTYTQSEPYLVREGVQVPEFVLETLGGKADPGDSSAC